jgi:large subunit ribosomal protein L6
MSRLGRKIIPVPTGVSVQTEGPLVTVVKGNAKLVRNAAKGVRIFNESEGLRIEPLDDSKFSKSMWGTCRSLIVGMIQGITEGFTTSLEIIGVGYKAEVSGNLLIMSLGYSHEIFLKIPADITVTCEKNTLVHIKSADKEALGQFVASIQALRKKDPYKGKGIYKLNEYRRRKKGKNK